MTKERMAAFSDGVIAIIITIMVLELHAPAGTDWHAVRETVPDFLVYVLSFAYVAIYWNNHHHLLHTCERVTGGVLWANMHLLFWLSLIPLATRWMGEFPSEHLPAAVYGVSLLCPAIAYYVLQRVIVRVHGTEGALARALGSDLKGRLSPLLYVAGTLVALVAPWVAQALYVAVALLWLVPDRRIERLLDGGP